MSVAVVWADGTITKILVLAMATRDNHPIRGRYNGTRLFHIWLPLMLIPLVQRCY